MPVLDGSFEAFVTNLGKYNEGELVGEWVQFPTTEDKMKEVFERIGIGSKDEFGQVYEEWFITDYDCSIHGVSNLLGEYENLDKLNYLASRLDEMSRSELEHFVAIMDSGCDEVNDLDDLINLTYNLDNYDLSQTSRTMTISVVTTSLRAATTLTTSSAALWTTSTLSGTGKTAQSMKAAH